MIQNDYKAYMYIDTLTRKLKFGFFIEENNLKLPIFLI